MSRFDRTLNFIGGLPDRLMTTFPDFLVERSGLSRDEYLARLDFYDPGRWADEDFFRLPSEPPDSEETVAKKFGEINYQVLRYPSRYEPRHAEVGARLAGFSANRLGCLHLWRHEGDEPRPLVLCIHGFMMGDAGRAMRMFKIKKLFGLGPDVALYVLPHHGLRADDPRRQHLLNPGDVPLTIESFGQNLHDLHSAVLLLEKAGHERIGVIGASMGGYTAALYASVAASVEFMFMAVPAVDLYLNVKPRSAAFTFEPDRELREKTRRALALVSPLERSPVFEPDRIGVVAHAGDRMCPVELTREWVGKWRIKNYREVVGGHWLYLDRAARGKAWYEWLARWGFVEK